MKCTERNLITCAWTFYHSVIWSHVFLSLTWNLCQVHPAQWWSKIVLTFDCCCPHSIEVTSELLFWKVFEVSGIPPIYQAAMGFYWQFPAIPSAMLCLQDDEKKVSRRESKLPWIWRWWSIHIVGITNKKPPKVIKVMTNRSLCQLHILMTQTTLKLWEFNI